MQVYCRNRIHAAKNVQRDIATQLTQQPRRANRWDKVPSRRHEHAAPKSHRSSPLVLQPFVTVPRSSTHTSPARRRAGHR
ncbi:hypothetical protein K474DRAFT_783620 [Panus rudis PR-1116 ss-1]|nr:hypothetical protein K474DRAFT_783620 [Panus rudis PR-1116 ss-1]